MRLDHLWIADFRNFAGVELELEPDGLTVVVGENGQGKTNLLEAIAYVARLESFRGVSKEVLVRLGTSSAVVRAEGSRNGKRLLIEIEILPGGRDRVLLNKQRPQRARELSEWVRVTIFSPEDLEIIKSGPSARRRYLDEILASLQQRNEVARHELDRILRQRSTLLRQSGGRLDRDATTTLDVWDGKLAEVGEALASSREELVRPLGPLVQDVYNELAGSPEEVQLVYERSWQGDLLGALRDHRDEDLRRGLTLVGPHRDDVSVKLGGRSSRTHASQGEQRCLALALRLASHQLVEARVGSSPLLLLDDVFSELDSRRSEALVELLPRCQAVLTTTGALPARTVPSRTVSVRRGQIVEMER